MCSHVLVTHGVARAMTGNHLERTQSGHTAMISYSCCLHSRYTRRIGHNQRNLDGDGQRALGRGPVRVCASGTRKNRKKQKSPSSSSKSSSIQQRTSLDVALSSTLPSSKEEAIEQCRRGLHACVNALRAPKGMAATDALRERLWVQVDIPVMGTDVVEDSLSLAKELMVDHGTRSVVYGIPDSAVHKHEDNVITYSAMMSMTPRNAEFVVIIAPKASDVHIVESVASLVSKETAVVLVNPEWTPSLGNGDGGVDLRYTEFVQSFTAAYCFFPILIKPFMMKHIEGCVYRNSALDAKQQTSGTSKPWKIYMQQQDSSTYQLVGQMRARPSSSDVESALYNAIAVGNNASSNDNPLKKLFRGGRGS